MKKIFALILAVSLIFLCACTGNDTSGTTVTTTAVQTTSESEKVIISEWNSDLLPADFPAPPEGTFDLEIAKGNHLTDESDYASDWVRMRFTCPQNNFFNFTNELLTTGYIGRTRTVNEIDNIYYRNGVHGYWRNDANIVKINSSHIQNGNLTVIIDIVPCTKGLPEKLLEFFPDFDGCCVGNGFYCGHDASLEFITSEPGDTLNPNWHWEFLCTGNAGNAFIGVTEDEFDDYCDLLGKAKFSGPITEGNVDGFKVTMVDAIKDIDGTTYGAYMIYNPDLMILEFGFTNNPVLITKDY
ncbi:MAG: hypothetical protein E7516_06205 [Ruminococcaceae bacterium]|nr:hypothetical protein [Oscillospiraceae bacterium]